MSRVMEKKYEGQGYDLHIIPSNKYKTNTIAVKFKAPLERDSITKRALLPYVLQQATEQYPTARSFRTALDELYGAVLSVDASKKGEHHVMTFRMEVANDAFLSNQTDLLKKGMKMMEEIIFHPKVDNGGLEENVIDREKQTLTQKIRSLKDDKMSYANTRLLDEMCENEAYRFHVHGYEEDLSSITSTSLYEYYQHMLNKDKMDVYILGQFDEAEVESVVQESFSRKDALPNAKVQSGKQQGPEEPKEIVEKQNIQQGKLHLGYRTSIQFGDDDYYALQVFNGLFGGFPSSKLFMNVREKHSLAYYAASRFESHKGLLLVFSGIDPNDYNQAKDIIMKQMDAMKKGDFEEEEVAETKSLIVNQLLETMDNQHGLIEVLYHQVISGASINPDQMIEEVKKVTKEDVLRVAEKIQLDTTYFLTKQEGGDDHE
ncbi:insulinase family protein [Pontibacillus yanchengensis]|uniref:Insulinase family protein n=2 Tax=Pontibacillus yanchengensis TaxID=462910 RepID=A0ACC7VB55_9BACI|nr:pitrilysin family protein [Pontibacillus yanchengensis]MYL33208.1 insulinase family protein [Pontibacillus yanchengensis]MYL51942.1 insulinase family protein [Pontibacillus yanchengensis]